MLSEFCGFRLKSGVGEQFQTSNFRVQTSSFHLPVNPREPVLDGIAPASRDSIVVAFEASERKEARRRQIADAVFVVNRQRLSRFAGNRRRTPSHVEQLAPA